MESRTTRCGVCAGQSVTTSAARWCAECDEAFCFDCIKHHSIAKATKQHKVVGVEKYEKIPDFVLNVKQECGDHGERCQIYCASHDTLCCIKCINNVHTTCINMKTLDQVVRDPISSIWATLEELKKRLQNIESFYCDICKEQTEYIEDIKGAHKVIQDDIVKFRQKLNQMLDTLQCQIHKSLDDMEKSINKRTKDLTNEIAVNQKRISFLLEAIPAIKENASDIQIFLGTKEMEAHVDMEEKNIADIINDEKLTRYYPKFAAESKIIDFLKEIQSLGEIVNVSRDTNVMFRKLKDKQAQIVTLTREKIHLKQIKTFTISANRNGTIMSCAILPDKQMIFLIVSLYTAPSDADPKDAKLVLLDKNGREVSSLNISSWSFDMAYIKDKTVAISSSRDAKIVFVNIETKTEEKLIKTNHVCYGLAYTDDKLYSCGKEGFETRRLSTNAVTKLKIDSCNANGFRQYEHFALHASNLIATNNLEDEVACYNVTGPIKWNWCKPEILKGLCGIAVDTNGNIYVTGRESQNIVIISGDGNQFEQVAEKYVSHPGALAFDISTNHLLVCGEQNGAVLYSVTK